MEIKKQDLLDNETEITRENVQRIGEVLALIVIRYVSSHTRNNLYWLYNGLLRDMSRRPDSENHYSEGYDIASTAICFLCDHIGKKLGDPVVNKYGKTITVNYRPYLRCNLSKRKIEPGSKELGSFFEKSTEYATKRFEKSLKIDIKSIEKSIAL